MTVFKAMADFRSAPSQATALAYMEAALTEWDGARSDNALANIAFAERMRDIRDWMKKGKLA